MPQPQLLQQGFPVNIINAVAIGALTSDVFCIPGKAGQNTPAGSLTWSSVFTGGPSAVSAVLEGSFDGVLWTQVDATTVTAGEARSVVPLPNFRQYRIRMVSNTGGTLMTFTVSIG